MSSRRVSARRRPVPRLFDSPVTGHVPPATLHRDSDGRYCVTERLQPSRTAGGGGAIGGALGKSPRERGGTSAQPEQRPNTDTTPLSRRAVTNTPSGSGVNKGENTTPQHAPVSGISRQTDSASSGVRSLTLALSDHGSSPEIGGHRSASDTPPGRPPGTSGPARARSGAPAGTFDSDEDDIFESDLRGRISDVITLLRGDTDLSADGGADGGGRMLNGTAGSSGVGGASGDAEDGTEPLRPKRVLDFELAADAGSAADDRGDSGVARALPLPAGAPPCRLPPAHVTADTSVAARARHVVGRRPGERVLSELAELARSPGSPLVRQKARNRVRAAARSVTPQGRAAGGPARGEVTPVSARRRGETAQPGEGRAPLAERELNGQVPDPPEPWKSPTGPRKAAQSVVSPVVLIRHCPEDANGDVNGGDPEVAVGSPRARLNPCTSTDRENQTPRTRKSPRLAAGGGQSHLPAAAAGCSSPAAGGGQSHLPAAAAGCSSPAAGGRQSHLPAAAAGCSSPAAAREDQDEIASTQPASKLVLDEVVAYVDVRSGADNRSEPIRTQLRALGALVVERFTKSVTHVIFKDGSKATYDRARRDRLRLVSVLWVDACRRQRERVDENLYPPAAAERYESPLFPARLRKLRSMQPRDFDEEMAAADRRFERRRRQQGRQPAGGQTRPGKRPAMTSPKRWGRRTVEELLTPRGRQRSAQVTADTGSSEDELPLNVRLFNRFMSPTGAWSTGGAVRRTGSPTAKLAAQISASPELESRQRRSDRSKSSRASLSSSSAEKRTTRASTSVTAQPSTSAGLPNGAAAWKPPAPRSKLKRILPLDSDSDSSPVRSAAVGAESAPAGRRRRRRLMTPPESQSLLRGPLLDPVTPAGEAGPPARSGGAHPALGAQTGRRRRTGRAGTGSSTDSSGRAPRATARAPRATGGSVRRLSGPRRSSLDFESVSGGRLLPRARLVLTNLHSVERGTLAPIISRLGGVTLTDEVTAATTHVVSGQPRRTLSVLGALAVGAWLLSPEWVLSSLEAGRWLPEECYEQRLDWPGGWERRCARGPPSIAPPAPVDDTGLTETTFSARVAAARDGDGGESEGQRGERGDPSGRPAPSQPAAAAAAGRPGLDLFAGAGAVYISGETQPPAEALVSLVRLAGGVVAAAARGATVAVGRPVRGVESVSEIWLLDSLQKNRLLPKLRYLRKPTPAAGGGQS